jgi:uncharacterized protein DUF3175
MVTKSAKKRATKRSTKKVATKEWSGVFTKHSNALDLERDVFKKKDPKEIARSLKRSAEHSHRKKSGPYQSAMSMLNFYINRAGKNLTSKEKQLLEEAKVELRKLFHRKEK